MSQTTAPPASPAAAPPPQPKAFGRPYWMLNSIEMFERLAYFGIRSVVPLYIMQATEPGGLHLTAIHKGWIYMWWAILQSWLPMFTGGIADRYGYKRVLSFAISANVVGYLMMAFLHTYEGFFAGILVLATGTAFFKPALQGSIAQNLTKANSSVGWSIFYWVVNVGAVLAPFLATMILGMPHSAEGWRNLFIASAVYTSVNLLLLLTFRDVPSGADKTESLIRVFGRTVENIWPFWFVGGRMHPVRGPVGILLVIAGLILFIFYSSLAEMLEMKDQQVLGLSVETVLASAGGLLFFFGALLATWLQGGVFQWQLRLPIFLLIMSCFWMMMYQLWDLQPNFITDWIDSSDVARSMKGEGWPWTMFWEYGAEGNLQVPQQILLNLNAALIVALVIPIGWAARNMRTLSAMMIGMSMATVGVLVAGLTQVGWFLLLGVVFFSLGEMWTGPKKNEYLGLIAPPGKKGLYLGYVNIPVGVGVGLGSWIAGIVYDNYGEKATLALKELGARPALVGRAAQSVDWSDSLDKLPGLLGIDRYDALPLAEEALAADVGAEPAVPAADQLLTLFRNDIGQAQNLAYLYLARDATYAGLMRTGLSASLRKDAQALQESGAAAAPPEPPTTQIEPPARPVFPGTHDDMVRLAQEIEEGTAELGAGILGRYVGSLPKWTDKKPVEVLAIVRELVNQNRPPEEALSLGQTIDMLWEEYGDEPVVLNNLALEYLAQGTPRLRTAVSNFEFTKPVKEIPERVGIDRTKAFAALSAAEAAGDVALDEALADVSVPSGEVRDRLYAFLISQPHLRYIAVAKRDWTNYVPELRTMVSSDPAAQALMERRVDVLGVGGRIKHRVYGLFGWKPPADVYARLAMKMKLVQEVLAAKDWNQTPEQAASLLELNPFEARAVALIEISGASRAVTDLLWDEYNPQYKVWLPFAAIGVLATIALAIFGQMAKRWADMNA